MPQSNDQGLEQIRIRTEKSTEQMAGFQALEQLRDLKHMGYKEHIYTWVTGRGGVWMGSNDWLRWEHDEAYKMTILGIVRMSLF